ncbi:MAG: MnhB domain-containing protein [Acetobacteraceae bacterium]|nr:MnhB domain-containing protein [Acetobacteraceae bacterium]
MKPRVRTALFLAAAAGAMPALVRALPHFPAFGDHPSPYADRVLASAPVDRHVQNVVTALNFDYRGFDTLGEEFILLCAVTGVTVLLRGSRGEHRSARTGQVEGRPVIPPGEAVTLIARLFGVATFVLGLSVALHATSTPGGGFQGGVLIASGFLLVFLGEGYRGWRAMMQAELMDAVEAAGALVYVGCGLVGVWQGLPYLTNTLPLGTAGSVWAGGLMPVINAGVTCAVLGGFGMLFIEFLEETRVNPDAEQDTEAPKS